MDYGKQDVALNERVYQILLVTNLLVLEANALYLSIRYRRLYRDRLKEAGR